MRNPVLIEMTFDVETPNLQTSTSCATIKDRHCLLNNLFIAMFGDDVEARVTMAAKIIGQKKGYRLGWGSAAT